MLKLIEGSRASLFPMEIDAMFRNRAVTFSERLGWDVTVKDGYERDEFDDANPLYLVSVDPNTNEYWGSLRLLPTRGQNVRGGVFPVSLARGDCASRGRHPPRPDPDQLWARCPHLQGSKSRRLQSAAHRQAAPDREHHELRGAFRHRGRPPVGSDSVPRGARNRAAGIE